MNIRNNCRSGYAVIRLFANFVRDSVLEHDPVGMEKTPQYFLKRYFGYDSFRPVQEKVINHLLSGRDALVLMPTGGGKSICFQIPALMLPGTAVVISPLISLMKDQVDALRTNGIPAAAMNSSLSAEEIIEVQNQCRSGALKLLYLSPERLQSELAWIRANLRVSLFVVDEAHCISSWGHDFRPEYTQLGGLHEQFPGVPVGAFTATADKVTRDDILTQLGIDGKYIFISSFDRPNLSLSVVTGCSDREKIAGILSIIERHRDESGIIYCMTRRTAEDVAGELRRKGIACERYHAGLDSGERQRIQEDFKNDRLQVVCATVAFGMGIDKADVRFVVHYNMAGSIESYYQEIGRGGRDGLPCETVLFYNLQDLVTLRRFAEESGLPEINRDKLRRMQDYAESTVCRRRILLNYFGEPDGLDCGNCDVCQNPPKRFDGTEIVQKMLSAIVRTGQRVSSTVAIDILLGENTSGVTRMRFNELKTFGAGRDISREDWKSYLLQMIHLGFVEVDVLNYRRLKVTQMGDDVLYGRRKAELSVPEKRDFRVRAPRMLKSAVLSSANEDKGLFTALKTFRSELARQERMPAYIVLSDRSLHDLAARRPRTVDDFGQCSGIGESRKKKYGPRFVRFISDYCGTGNGAASASSSAGTSALGCPPVRKELTDKALYVCSRMEQLKSVYANAYAKWTEDDDRKLEELAGQGRDVNDIAERFGRNAGAVRSRLKKLGLK